MPRFDHERLDVYNAAIQFLAAMSTILSRLPSGHGHLANQLQRAAASITLNIAEGAGEFSRPDKIRFYRMARRSATECAAILDVLQVLTLADERDLVAGRDLLDRIVAMLTQMTRVRKKPEAEAEAGKP